MKILIINGSPRKNGNIARLLQTVAAELKSSGVEIDTINISELSVASCHGCMACRSTRRCVLPADDSVRALAMINSCQAMVIGAPCYWGNIPGQLKTMFDRIVYGMMGESPHGIPIPLHKGKKAMIISTCTTRWPWNRIFNQSAGAINAMKEILKWSGFKTVAKMQIGDTKRRPLPDKYLTRAAKLARRLL